MKCNMTTAAATTIEAPSVDTSKLFAACRATTTMVHTYAVVVVVLSADAASSSIGRDCARARDAPCHDQDGPACPTPAAANLSSGRSVCLSSAICTIGTEGNNRSRCSQMQISCHTHVDDSTTSPADAVLTHSIKAIPTATAAERRPQWIVISP